jgi:transcriptional regulator GlxA family with amidase domain
MAHVMMRALSREREAEPSSNILDALLPDALRACVQFHRRVKAALDFGLRDPSRSVTLGDVADHVGMEKTAFCRYFKLKVGRPYVGIVRALRVRYAAELLCTSDYSITEVTALAGFESRATFARTFRSQYGVTPSEYRSRNVPAPDER